MTKLTAYQTTSNNLITRGVTYAKSSIAIAQARRSAYSTWTPTETYRHIVNALSTQLPKEFDARNATDYRNALKRSWKKIFDEDGRELTITGSIKKGFVCSSNVKPEEPVKTPPTDKDGETTENDDNEEAAKTDHVEALVEKFIALTEDDKKAFLEKLGLTVK